MSKFYRYMYVGPEDCSINELRTILGYIRLVVRMQNVDLPDLVLIQKEIRFLNNFLKLAKDLPRTQFTQEEAEVIFALISLPYWIKKLIKSLQKFPWGDSPRDAFLEPRSYALLFLDLTLALKIHFINGTQKSPT